MQPLMLFNYLSKMEAWGTKIAWTLIIVFTGYAALRIVSKLVDHFLPAREMPDRPYGTPQEIGTLASLIKSILKYVTAFLALGFLFRVFNINLTPLLVSAGVVGFTVGFGAQSFIRDCLSGLTLLFEKNLSVGDCVEIGGSAGVIEEIGIRTTKIRDLSGQLHILFNGNITLVKNFTTQAVRVTLDVFLQKKEDIIRAKKILHDSLEDYVKNYRLGGSEITVSELQMRSPQTVIRAEFDIIPLFKDLVSQQVAPRLKEVFFEQAIPLSGNRIDANFHLEHPQIRDSGLVREGH